MDYFNETERARKEAFAAMRDKLFAPVINLLLRLGATPNQVSLAGVAFLLVAALLPPIYAIHATVCMALYLTFDGLDGPLARRTGRAHAGGSLVDIVSDQLGVLFLPASAIYHFDAWGPAMVIFSASYLLFIGLVVYANELRIRVRTFVRTKYLFFALYLLSLHLKRDLVSHFCSAFGAYYLAEVGIVLHKIYVFHDKRSREADPPEN